MATNEMAHLENSLPREGTVRSAGGEPLTESQDSVCPTVSGGGQDCHRALSLASGVETAAAVQPRMLILDDGQRSAEASPAPMCVEKEGGALSDCSLVAARSRSDGESHFWRKRHQEADLSESSGGEAIPDQRVRRRGRPPTTGEYVGLYKAKTQFIAAKREEMRLRAEEELEASIAPFRKNRGASDRVQNESVVQLHSKTATELHSQIQNDVALIDTIVNKSRNIKTTLVRDLKKGVSSITGAASELAARTASDEVRRLRFQNADLQAEIANIRTELASLKTEMARMRAQEVAPSPSVEVADNRSAPKRRRVEPEAALTLEENICRIVTVTVGARLAALEGRLLPERTVRPPLASDKRALVNVEPGLRSRVTAPKATSAPKVPGEKPKASAPKAKKGQKKKTEEEVFVPAPPPPPLTEAWSTVMRKGAKKGQPRVQQQPQTGQQPGTQQQPQTGQQQRPRRQPQTGQQQRPRQQPQAGQKGGKRKRERKLRTPRSAAVVITLKPEAVTKGLTYGQVLAEARARVNLAEIGIAGVRIKKTATGARSMEVAGANNAERADSLAAKLRQCLGDEVVRVHRPMRTAEIRVSGLDDSVTVEEISAAIAKVGGCPLDQIQTGAISVGASGLGSAWLRCPVTAAKKVVDGGRLLVGWVSAQVKLLEARTQRCYRCLEAGHVRAACKAEVDRSEECYRCGATSHKARGCTAPAYCKTCSAAGKPADHRSGGKACISPPPKGNRKNRKSRKSSAGGPGVSTQNSRPSDSRAEAEGMAVG